MTETIQSAPTADDMRRAVEAYRLRTGCRPGSQYAALIDMDGVLYDSMKYHTLAWQRMVSEQGIDCSRDEFYLYEGMTGKATIDLIWRRERGVSVSDDEVKRLYAIKARYFVEMGRKEAMPGADRMLKALSDAGWARVLVTGSAQSSLLERLDDDYPGAFLPERRVTALDVKHGKPDPEPYLRGLQKIGAAPCEAIVIENAPLGVRAGVAAGCFTVTVTTGPIPRTEFEKERADLIFPSMSAFADALPTLIRIFADSADETSVTDSAQAVLGARIDDACRKAERQNWFVITDANVEKALVPLFSESCVLASAPRFTVSPGEANKTPHTLFDIWQWLSDNGATRRSGIINVGGGLVTDLGGFAAATFKRGIPYINVPTTLLGAVDAAVGGKTAVNLGVLKNEVGAFAEPLAVVVSTVPFASLSRSELLSGYAEMIKTGFISSPELYQKLRDVDGVLNDARELETLMCRCMDFKSEVTSSDLREGGRRKILNFGHTAGHAFEALSRELGRPLPHGVAVAYGMLTALVLSHIRKNMPTAVMYDYVSGVLLPYYHSTARENGYSPLAFSCEQYPRLLGLMGHDKKNVVAGRPRFVLLDEPGHPVIDIEVASADIEAALDITRDLLGL
ncbi:MAG: HAD-IA family hydrolase [Muribaculaceae bacterium]|nr:HAD-IA family hydrolase [Muribaculaceae bacterium]